MNTKSLIDSLIDKYHEGKYSMSAGSGEWVDIKTDYELDDDALMGTILRDDYSTVGKDKISEFRNNLLKIKDRVVKYVPIDSMEEEEKKILENKMDIGIKIYDQLLA